MCFILKHHRGAEFVHLNISLNDHKPKGWRQSFRKVWEIHSNTERLQVQRNKNMSKQRVQPQIQKASNSTDHQGEPPPNNLLARSHAEPKCVHTTRHSYTTMWAIYKKNLSAERDTLRWQRQ